MSEKLTKRDRIIYFLFEHHDQWFTCEDIAQACECSLGTVSTYANNLVKECPATFITRKNHDSKLKEYCCTKDK